MSEVQKLIAHFKMEKHPEGGHFVETYRSEGSVQLEAPFYGARSYCTGIYFLLSEGERSAFHKIKSDEIWHFHLGDSMTLHQISPEGNLETIIIGSDFSNGEKLQHVVPAGYWFGGYTNGKYSFVGCTVAPGFDFKDFELADTKELKKKFPEHREIIEKLS